MKTQAIIMNASNKTIKPHLSSGGPTLAELAALSLDVYYAANDPKKPPLLPGWTRFKDTGNTTTGYFGACYTKKSNVPHTYFLVFASRGTEFTDPRHILGDLQIMLEAAPLQYATAKTFRDETRREAIEYFLNIDDDDVMIYANNTGHSLGAIVADLLSMEYGLSVTFENPGSKNIAKGIIREAIIKEQEEHDEPPLPSDEIEKSTEDDLEELSSNCTAYQADVNLINTCNEQLGDVFRLVNLPYDYSKSIDQIRYLEKSPIINFYYLAYTKHQHQLDNIVDYLKNSGNTTKLNRYPFGFNKGYAAYVDYEARKVYWDAYQHIVWDRYPDIRNLFGNDESKFHDDLVVRLNECRDSNQISTKDKGLNNLNDFVMINKKSCLKSEALTKVGLFRTNGVNSPDENKEILAPKNSCIII